MTIKNLIENVTIIDGLGNEPFKGNVLIENNLISINSFIKYSF